MDRGVMADANQEVWLGDGLKVARGGLLADCVGWCFFRVSNISIPFMLLVHAHACLCKVSISKNGMIFIFYISFSIRRSNENVS